MQAPSSWQLARQRLAGDRGEAFAKTFRPLAGSLPSELKQRRFTLYWMSVRNPQGQEVQYQEFLGPTGINIHIWPLCSCNKLPSKPFSQGLVDIWAHCLELRGSDWALPNHWLGQNGRMQVSSTSTVNSATYPTCFTPSCELEACRMHDLSFVDRQR